MSAHIQNDSTDPATKRPNSPPLESVGSEFIPVKIDDFEYIIQLPEDVSCDDPISIFDLYYSPRIIDQLVQYINQFVREPEDPGKLRSQARNWYPTCRAELYTYLAIRVYMTIHGENEIPDYWNKSETAPVHSISKHMSRDRFQELHIRWRCHKSGTSGLYEKVGNCLYLKVSISFKLSANLQYRLIYSQIIFSELISRFGLLV